jgi:hypothetical protein
MPGSPNDELPRRCVVKHIDHALGTASTGRSSVSGVTFLVLLVSTTFRCYYWVMPKLSVSIPDDLWQQAVTVAGKDKKASQIIQDALRREVSDHEITSSFGRALVSDEFLGAVIDKVRADAEQEYGTGYLAGLRWVEEKGFDGLRSARILDWDAEDILDVTDLPSSWDDDLVGDMTESRNEILRDGFVRSLQECWRALREQSPLSRARTTSISESEADPEEEN